MAHQAHFFISIVAPIFNEENNLDEFYNRVSTVLQTIGMPYEIIFINDGSTDQSLKKLMQFHDEDKHIKLIELSRNFGKEIATTAGLDSASGDVIIPIDTDLQDPPEIIPDLIAKWQEGYDVVYATRQEREGETYLKKITARLFYKIMNRFSDVAIPKNTGDFRLISKEVLQAVNSVREKCRFMKGVFSWVGYKQTSIMYVRPNRFMGKSKWSYKKLINFAIEGITSYSTAPLQFASYLGILTASFSLLYGIFFLIKTLIFGNPVPGYPSLLIFMLFFSGVQLTALGIIGEYIGRIYRESKERPLYITKRKVGFNGNE